MMQGAWTAGTRWYFEGQHKRSATLPNGVKAIVWRTHDGVAYSAGGVLGYAKGRALSEQCEWLVREASGGKLA